MEPDNSPPPSSPNPQRPVVAQVVPEPLARPPRRRIRILGPLVIVMLVLLLGGSVLLNLGLIGLVGMGSLSSDRSVQEQHFSHQSGAANKVAIVSVEGVIITGDGFFKRQIDRVRDDDSVKAIVLRVNSPGGTISGSDYMYHHLKKLADEREIPVVVSMGGIAASGGYYVSMAVGDRPDTIYAEPTTWTGSIGVIIPHYDCSVLLNDKLGITEDSIASHKLKGMGGLAKAMTPQEKAIFQALVDDSFARFKSIVRDGRPRFKKDPGALDRLATGQVYSADQALAAGLVDKLGFLEDAVDRAIALTGLDEDEVEVVRYKPEPTLTDLLLGAKAQSRTPDVATLLDMTAPRAYYLSTSLPALVASSRAARGEP